MKYIPLPYKSIKQMKFDVYHELKLLGYNVIVNHKVEEYCFEMVIVMGEEIPCIISFKDNGKLGPDHYFQHYPKGDEIVIKCTLPYMIPGTIEKVKEVVNNFPRVHI